MKKMLNEKGEKIKVNRGREHEMRVCKYLGIKYQGIDNINHVDKADIEHNGRQIDIKTERGSIVTREGDSRLSKDLTRDEKISVVKQTIDLYAKSIQERRKYWFSILGDNENIVYEFNKAQWVAFLKAFCVTDNATDKGKFLKVRLDAKTFKAYGKMLQWIADNDIKSFSME